jgi:PAS domain-containing protein
MEKPENRVAYLPEATASANHMNAEKPAGMEIADVFAGADIGLALFDSQLSLLACNPLYRSLCGYLATEATSGQKLQELIRISYRRMNVPLDEIQEKIDRIVTALEPGTRSRYSRIRRRSQHTI